MRAIIPVLAAVILSPSMVWAGPCDATFNFDGNLLDSSGNGNDGTMIGKGGVPAKPVFVEGRSGQALRFDGTSAMRAPLDLYIKNCPQVTISAWVKIDADSPKTTQFLLSTGSGSGPGIRISGTGLSLHGPANGLFKGNAIRPNSGWRFVAGVYDYEAGETGTFALHWRDRPLEPVSMSSNVREWEDMLWVGAMNDSLSPAAKGIVIDDVRIEGRVLGYKDLRSLRTQIPAQAPGTEGVFGNNSVTDGDNACTAAQVAGTYRSEYNVMQCESQGGATVSCCYGADCGNTLNLTVAGNGRSATGSWQQPGGTSGSASFQIDESCSLSGGQWGLGTAAPTRPWDTTGVVSRTGGSTSAPASGGSGGGISPPDGRVVIPGPVEQIEQSAEDALPGSGGTTNPVSAPGGGSVMPGPAEQIDASVETALVAGRWTFIESTPSVVATFGGSSHLMTLEFYGSNNLLSGNLTWERESMGGATEGEEPLINVSIVGRTVSFSSETLGSRTGHVSEDGTQLLLQPSDPGATDSINFWKEQPTEQ